MSSTKAVHPVAELEGAEGCDPADLAEEARLWSELVDRLVARGETHAEAMGIARLVLEGRRKHLAEIKRSGVRARAQSDDQDEPPG